MYGDSSLDITNRWTFIVMIIILHGTYQYFTSKALQKIFDISGVNLKATHKCGSGSGFLKNQLYIDLNLNTLR